MRWSYLDPRCGERHSQGATMMQQDETGHARVPRERIAKPGHLDMFVVESWQDWPFLHGVLPPVAVAGIG
jgi:hypothetical protein